MPTARLGPVFSVFSNPGAGLLWGLGGALLLWLTLPAGLLPLLNGGPQMTMLDAARAHFRSSSRICCTSGFPSDSRSERSPVCARRHNMYGRLLAWLARW